MAVYCIWYSKDMTRRGAYPAASNVPAHPHLDTGPISYTKPTDAKTQPIDITHTGPTQPAHLQIRIAIIESEKPTC